MDTVTLINENFAPVRLCGLIFRFFSKGLFIHPQANFERFRNPVQIVLNEVM